VEIGSCSSLCHFDAGANQQNGSIPEGFDNLANLNFLNLSSIDCKVSFHHSWRSVKVWKS
jgi:hypothetical protein